MTQSQLDEYLTLKEERNDLQRMIRELDILLYGQNCSDTNNIPSGSAISRRTEKLALKRIKLQQQYQRKVDYIAQKLSAIEEAISSLENPIERRVLRLHYLEGLKWKAVSRIIGYERSQTFRYHTQALQHLQCK